MLKKIFFLTTNEFKFKQFLSVVDLLGFNKYVFEQLKTELSDATVFLNVPLVKASLVSSQMRLYDVKFNALLSTQINYAPSIFKLTQPQDREKLYIANSISKADGALDSNNEILGQNLNFNWVGYSASVGLDYIYATYLNRGAQRLFNESVEDSQIIYDTKVLKAGEYGFYEQ